VQAHRNNRAIALIVAALREKGAISDAKIDELLLEIVS